MQPRQHRSAQQTSIVDRTPDAAVDTYETRYDGLGRPDQVRELKVGTARSTTTYGYDANSNLTSWFADDQVAPQTDQYSAYSYDVRDMLESIKTGTSPTDTAVKTTSYTYTSRGQRATETKPNGNKVAYRWIEDGLMRSQIETQDLGGKLVSSHALAYNLDGQQSTDVSKVQNADSPTAYLNQTANMVYTADNRLRWISKSGANPGGYEGYSYDAAGNTTWQQQGTTSTFYKNDRNRLLCAGATSADPCAGSSYNYDPFGRLDTITAGDKTVERYGYDGFDRMVSDRKYDPATGASKSSQTSVFDPLDRTVSKSTAVGTGAAKTTTFSYLGLSDQVISEEQPDAGGAAKSVASYTYGPTGERISQTKTPLTGGTAETSYYGVNPHTDVETLTSDTGDARSTYRYTGYGNNDATGFTGKDKATATGGPEVEAYNPYRFNSKRWDPATSGYDMGFRDYSPGLNRFLTRDMYNGALADLQLGTDPWNTNRYAFAGGNPITGIELDGHINKEESGGGGVVGASLELCGPDCHVQSTPNGVTVVGADSSDPVTDEAVGAAGKVSDLVVGPLLAGPQLVGTWGTRASHWMQAKYKPVRQLGSKYLRSLRGNYMRDIGRWAKTPAANKLGCRVAGVGLVISFANHRADGDRVLAAVAKTGVETVITAAFAEGGTAVGAAVGSLAPGAGTAVGGFVGAVAGSVAGSFVGSAVTDSVIGDGIESSADTVQDVGEDVIGGAGDLIGRLFD